MTVLSMTGYGSSSVELSDGAGQITIALRSVNHRNLDLRFRVGLDIGALEMELRSALRKRLHRGHVDVTIQWNRDEQSTAQVHVDESLAQQLGKALETVNRVSGLDTVIDLSTLTRFPGVITLESDTRSALSKDHEKAIVDGVQNALDGLIAMRSEEGARIAAELSGRVGTVRTIALGIQESTPRIVEAHRERLRTRIAELTDQTLDEGRLEQEVAVLADKADVAEELSRIESHCLQFDAELSDEAGTSGKKLEFIAQELLRELNTIGSKSPDTAIRSSVIEAKAEMERIREQLANVE